MIVDLNKVDSDPFQENKFDVCICGAGIVGITLALKLSRTHNVVLLEAGDYNYSDTSQAVYKGANIGHQSIDLTATRLRYFGGTSNHWSGWCRPLDSHDFKRKTYVKLSGWPIEHSDLESYLDESKSILDISSKTEIEERTSSADVPGEIGNFQEFNGFDFWWSTPTRFGEKYRANIESASNITCYLNANVVDIGLANNLAHVSQVEVRNYAGRTFQVRARANILATGGIENPRLLLNSTNQISDGLGNENGLVGRFFAQHPHQTVGTFLLQDQARENLLKNWVNVKSARKFFSPSVDLMQEEEILNFGLRFQPFEPDSEVSFEKRLERFVCKSELAKNTVEKISGKNLSCPSGDGLLRIASEQALNPSSRITLGSELDRFGKRRVVCDWRHSEIDERTIRRAVIRFGIALADMDLGRVRIADWLLNGEKGFEFPSIGEGQNHHMCTTRMSGSQYDGVVDSDQRVFGIDNLYLAGSSVFSTTGHANPTFTIVQMTLRLADHLNEVLKTHL